MDFCLVDLTTTAGKRTLSDGTLTSVDLDWMASALMVQANRDAAPYWGGVVRVRHAAASGDGALPSEIPMVLVDDLSVIDAGADAFHTMSGTGMPTISVGLAQASAIFAGPNSLSVSFSHEILETMADPPCNAARADGTGWDWHQEIADPTQEDSYDLELDGLPPIGVSNFVLPAFFNPLDKTGPYDFCKLLTAPFSLRPGGYITRRPSAGGDVQIYGRISEARLASKRASSSRISRRGARP